MGSLLLKERLALFGKDRFAIQKRLQEFLSHQSQQKSSAFVICRNFLEALGQEQSDLGPYCVLLHYTNISQ